MATVAVPLAAPLRFAYPAPSLHVALETGTALIGLLATAIVVRGWRDGPRLDRLIIAAGLAVIAATSAVLAAMLAVSVSGDPRGIVALTGMLVGSPSGRRGRTSTAAGWGGGGSTARSAECRLCRHIGN